MVVNLNGDQSLLMGFAMNGVYNASDINSTSAETIQLTSDNSFVLNDISHPNSLITGNQTNITAIANPFQIYNIGFIENDTFKSPLPSMYTNNVFSTTPKRRKSELGVNKESRLKKSRFDIKITNNDAIAAYLVDLFESIIDLENEAQALTKKNSNLKTRHKLYQIILASQLLIMKI